MQQQVIKYLEKKKSLHKVLKCLFVNTDSPTFAAKIISGIFRKL